jgi:hypothetical protein
MFLRVVIGPERQGEIRKIITPLYRNKWKTHLQRMEHTRIPPQAYKYQPSGKRYRETKKTMEIDTTVLEAGPGDSPNP